MYLKNVTAETQKYTVQIDFEGGSYVLGLKELEAGQSVVVDLRRIRDRQEPDEHGNVIPLEATGGQVHWSVIGTDNHSMVGRAEYVNGVQGLTSTFACSSCCPNSFYDAWITPANATFPLSTDQRYSAYQQDQTCYGSLVGGYMIYPEWSIRDTLIAVVNPEGEVSSG